jgi:hypothetical protein
MRARRNDFPRHTTSIVMPFAPLGLAGASFNAEDESGQTPARLGKAETLYTQQCFVFVSYHCYWHDWLRLAQTGFGSTRLLVFCGRGYDCVWCSGVSQSAVPKTAASPGIIADAVEHRNVDVDRAVAQDPRPEWPGPAI